MKNYIQPGDTVGITAGATIESGDGVLSGTLFGVAVHDAASGDELQIATTGVFELPKPESEEWTVGAAIYWDGGDDEATTADDEGNVFIGVALAAAANPSETGIVRLNGSAPAAAES